MEEHRCPNCGARDDLMEFETIEMVDCEQGFFLATCKVCCFVGKQWYKLEFTGWADNDGNDLNEKE